MSVSRRTLRRALAISDGDLGVLVDSWFSRILYLVALLAVIGPPRWRLIRRRRAARTPEPEPEREREKEQV